MTQAIWTKHVGEGNQKMVKMKMLYGKTGWFSQKCENHPTLVETYAKSNWDSVSHWYSWVAHRISVWFRMAQIIWYLKCLGVYYYAYYMFSLMKSRLFSSCSLSILSFMLSPRFSSLNFLLLVVISWTSFGKQVWLWIAPWKDQSFLGLEKMCTFS